MSSSTSPSSSPWGDQPLGSFRVAGEHVQPIALPGEDDVSAQLAVSVLPDAEYWVTVTSALRSAAPSTWSGSAESRSGSPLGEPFAQPAKRLVDLPE